MNRPQLSRRRFIQGALACGSLLSVAPRIALAREGAAPGDTLVLVVLRGGLDGLSALVPVGDGAAYYDARRSVAVEEWRTLPVDDSFGLHPALSPLHELYREGVVALVPALGSPDASRSHFDQMRVLERGSAASVPAATGWLARHLVTRRATPLQAVAGSAQVPEVLQGAPAAIAVPSLDAMVGRLQHTADLATGGSLLLRLSGDGSIGSAAATSSRAALELMSVPVAADSSSDLPSEPGPRQLQDVARLLTAGVDLDAAVVDIGGWDLHAGMGDAERGPMQARLSTLARALHAFHRRTAALARPVTVVAVSEFGRRVALNGAAGTDHGRGGLLIAMGRGIRSGVFGSWPGLAADQLDQGDVRVANDFRDPLGEIVAARLGNLDLQSVFPGHTVQQLGLARPL